MDWLPVVAAAVAMLRQRAHSKTQHDLVIAGGNHGNIAAESGGKFVVKVRCWTGRPLRVFVALLACLLLVVPFHARAVVGPRHAIHFPPLPAPPQTFRASESWQFANEVAMYRRLRDVPELRQFVCDAKVEGKEGKEGKEGTTRIRLANAVHGLDAATATVADIKLGRRTWTHLASATPSERYVDKFAQFGVSVAAGSASKRSYMQWRDASSTSGDLGFRVTGVACGGAAVKLPPGRPAVDWLVANVVPRAAAAVATQLRAFADAVERSGLDALELVGTSVLIAYDAAATDVRVKWIDHSNVHAPVEESLPPLDFVASVRRLADVFEHAAVKR